MADTGVVSDTIIGNTGSSLKSVNDATRGSEFEQMIRDGTENEYDIVVDPAESAS